MPLSPQDDKFLNDFLAKRGMHPEQAQEPEAQTSMTGDFFRGLGQAALGPIEAPAQWLEHGIRMIPGEEKFKMPLHDWAANYRNRAESSGAGIAGEALGTIGSMFIPFAGLARAAQLAGRGTEAAADLGRFASVAGPVSRFSGAASDVGRTERAINAVTGSRPAQKAAELASRYPKTAFALKSGAAADLLQPASDQDFGREMRDRFALGAGLGGMAGQYMRMLGREGRVARDEAGRLTGSEVIPEMTRRPRRPYTARAPTNAPADYYRRTPVSRPVELTQRRGPPPEFRRTFSEGHQTGFRPTVSEEEMARRNAENRRLIGRSIGYERHFVPRWLGIAARGLGHAGAHGLGFPFYWRHLIADMLAHYARRAGYRHARPGGGPSYFERAVQGASPGLVGATATQVPNLPYYGEEALEGAPDESQGD